ncbi:hypothetical protein JCM9279_002023 [Rhodotorula babjevae]
MHYPPVPYPPCIALQGTAEQPDAAAASSEAASSSSPPTTKSTQNHPVPRLPSPRTFRSPFKRPAPTSSPSRGTRSRSHSGALARSPSPTPHHVGSFTWSEPVTPSKRVRAPAGLPFKAPLSSSSPAGECSSKRHKGALEDSSTRKCVLLSARAGLR